MAVRRCYCIECGKLHRRNPATWTAKGCTACGGEVRFTSPPMLRTLRLEVCAVAEDLELLGQQPRRRLEELVRSHLQALRAKRLRDNGIAAPVSVTIDDTAPPVLARRGRPPRRE